MTKNIIGKTLGTLGGRGLNRIADVVLQHGISPNILTATGVLINCLGGLLLALGVYTAHSINWIHIAAGVVILIANIFDALDGMVARASGKVTKFGAFFDSVVDRFSDIALFAGAITYFALRHDVWFVAISALALTGGLMTSYTRARAESILPGKYNSGYMERPERIMMLVGTAILNRLYMGMLFIAIFANLATFHRIWDARQTAKNLEYPEQARLGYGSTTASTWRRAVRGCVFWTYPRQTWQHDLLGVILLALILLSPSR